MTLDTAASALRRDDGERALALVGTAAGHARDAVTDVRRLVHGLRPPALDDLGLLGALQATAAGVSEGGPDVVVEGAGDIASLPAALEVAVLRIAQEALVNAVRHAGASRIHVAVRAGGDVVELEVADDGHGLHAGRTAGVGLASMRERAAELGGSCSVGPGRRGGTRVHAVIPRPVLS
jgi:signal transduction histidine kinase